MKLEDAENLLVGNQEVEKIMLGGQEAREKKSILPGVYWNQQLGLISISGDLVDWITLEDKNYGATNAWDGVSNWSYDVRGYHYQRGNDYGFINTTGTYIDNRTDVTAGEITMPYSSSTWITTNQWASNLHTLTRTGENIKTGYHIGSRPEFQSILDIFIEWGFTQGDVQKYLKMPQTGYRDGGSYFNSNNIRSNTGVRTGTHSGDNSQYSGGMKFTCRTDFNLFSNSWSTYGCQIRLFKDTVVVPDGNWIALYQKQ